MSWCRNIQVHRESWVKVNIPLRCIEFRHIPKDSLTMHDILEKRGAGFFCFVFWLFFKPVVVGRGEPTRHILWQSLIT